MNKILLGLFLVFSFFSFFSFSPIASATGFEDVDSTVPMTSTAQARLRIGVANFSKVWAYKATMTNGEVTGLSLVCQYASSSNGVNPIVKECTTFINNDNINLVLVAFSNNANAGVIADLLPGSGGVFALSDDVFYPRIISASVLAPGAVPTIAQLISEINYGFTSLPQDPIAQNGDPGWNYLPLSPDSAWIGAGLPVPTEPGHYIVKLIKNAGAGGSSGVPTLDFKANGQTSVTLTSAPSTTNPVNLTWTATGVSSCTASTTATPAAPAVWTGTKTTSGSFALTNLAASTNYVLKTDCSDSMGNHVIKTVNITTAPPASTVTLTSSDSDNSVLSTETFTLSWSSTGTPAGDSCSRSSTPAVAAWTLATAPDNGGPISIGPLSVGSYVFKVECNNPSGVLPTKASTTLTINVTAPVSSVIFTNPSVTVPAPGGNAILTWTPTNAGSCVISTTSTPAGPTGTTTGNSWTGTFPTAGTFTYKVTCTATGGALPVNPEATATVTVTSLPPLPSLSFTPPIPTSVQAGGTVTLAWTSSGMAANSCNRTGGFGTWATTGGATTGSATITAPNTTGDYTFTVTCTTTGGQSTFITAVVTVTGVVSPSVASVVFNPATNPTATVQVGQGTTLNWVPTNAGSCTVAYGGTTPNGLTFPTGNISGNSFATGIFTVPGTYTYTVTCNATGTATPANPNAIATVIVQNQVAQVASVDLAISSSSVPVGGNATLTWTLNNVATCNGSSSPAGWTSTDTTSGSWNIPTTTIGTYTYTITCTPVAGATAGTLTDTVVLDIFADLPQTPLVTLSPANSGIPIGSQVNLTWNSFHVSSCSKNVSSVPAGLVFPSNWTTVPGNSSSLLGWSTGTFTSPGTYIYEISCTGTNGDTVNASAVVLVKGLNADPVPPTVTLTAAPNPAQLNQSSVLTWSASGDITSCVKKDGPKAWKLTPGNSGTWQTGSLSAPGSVTYTFECTGPGGTTTKSVVVNWQAKVLVPTVTVSATPTTAQPGGTSVITWSSSNATSCTRSTALSGGLASLPVSVPLKSGPLGWTMGPLSLGTHIVTISCKNVNNVTASASASVVVKN